MPTIFNSHLVCCAACLVPSLCLGEPAPAPVRADCAGFVGAWSGTWSQGYYGTQRIHVTEVSEQCVAQLAYSPTEAAPQSPRPVPVKAGIMLFPCNVPGGSCRLEIKGDELRFTYTDPSGFVNLGTFRKDR